MALVLSTQQCTTGFATITYVHDDTCSSATSSPWRIVNNDYKPVSNRTKYKIKSGCRIRPVKGFIFGGCAAKAIASAFKHADHVVIDTFKNYKIDWENGVTYKQCEKVIQSLANRYDKTVRYVVNKRKLKFFDFVKTHRVGTYICSLDEHVSCVRNGIVIDSFLYGGGPVTELEGWWEIKHR
jgi:hypothetical protein